MRKIVNTFIVEGYISSKVLSFFNKSCGINMEHGQVRQKVIKWWLTKSKNKVHKMILLCLPNIICWHRRADVRQGLMIRKCPLDNQPTSHQDDTHDQFPGLQLSNHWYDFIRGAKNLKPIIQSQSNFWAKPCVGWTKLNVDRCRKGNHGRAGGDGIIRDHNGAIFVCFAKYYGHCSNNLAEAKAMHKSIMLCIIKGIVNVIVESHSIFGLSLVKKN
ncbi:hypothetical protein RDI58_001017 [Solanum bulbocastanum]|uniref:RNase H type-1 domain-containing protein n=1 Tax=Solanum bulbocastanum TaxID=147425 RepID=A0AAN8YMU0_SOLBU